ncbi:IGR protein motif-domain-containing protein [Lasiosphaeria hispida]|uniref:Small ribosomal subunit protein mS41 n=1 Tax=Lasiosphaeria hispida TaxID=260671 RepID=A0AAJ0HPZ9_9PEZI|nr:IGR protein motif-domain-containing protein [Lasiosphaeria hispida]
MKPLRIPSALGLLLRSSAATPIISPNLQTRARWAHKGVRTATPTIPPTTPFVPDVDTFLTVIGRGLKEHASKFPTWEALFSLNTDQLRELGVEPPRTRKYLLRWRQRFQEGKFGIGGGAKYVENGTAYLRIKEVDLSPTERRRCVVNVPGSKTVETMPEEELAKVKGFSVKGVRTITGPYVLPAGPERARVTVTEGMWEDRRGHKIDGGERRQAEVRFKKRLAERKALREKQGFY